MRNKRAVLLHSQSGFALVAILGLTFGGCACSSDPRPRPLLDLGGERPPAACARPGQDGAEIRGLIDANLRTAEAQYGRLLARLTGDAYPRSAQSDGALETVNARDWVSGFFPGALWLLYAYSGDDRWATAARRYTDLLKPEQFDTSTHDVGFVMMSSFGQGQRVTGDPSYPPVLLRAATSLASRFDRTVGCIRSWSWGPWRYPVIIDNMMNLELLYWAAAHGGPAELAQLASTHADTTLANHFRPDASSFHLVDYDPSSGAVRGRMTVQGYAASSAWARGQAWGLYGYTMAYRFTRDPKYLRQAQRIADFMLHHPRMPSDLVPCWDYDAPPGPDSPRDTSAAAVMGSGLIELAGALGDEGAPYLEAADRVLRALSSPAYRAEPGEAGGFLLKHGVGNWPSHSEVDAPLIYGDYYFLEANLRRLARLQSAGPCGAGS